MEKSVLSAGGDPMGAAIYDFHRNGSADVLKVYSSDFDDDEIPVSDLFREYEDMPYIETIDGFEDRLQYLLKYNTPINQNASLKNIDIDDVEILDLQVEPLMEYEDICKMLIKKCNIKKHSYITKARIPSTECVMDRGLYSIEFSDDVWKHVKKIKKF